ncbi:hypothetical protein [Shimazuella alba]|uniref:Uncharacterized protein n=1 Tax=Shimazuella alba TaxID=2690964 RepID=A0A6I4VZB8_9BACL|nr:hypothetical protein [Shimazuella alba]MXQ55275.1 hypothetical protein [Shimazuella alba]
MTTGQTAQRQFGRTLVPIARFPAVIIARPLSLTRSKLYFGTRVFLREE